MTTQSLERRAFLKTAGKTVVATTAMAATGSDVLAGALTAPPKDVKTLSLFNTHTLETLEVEFSRNGIYDKAALGKLNVLLRDHRENETIAMDRELFDQMWALQQTLQQKSSADKVFEIISGYRSPVTNNKLRMKSSGVAENSYHIKGQAIDLRLRGTKLSQLHQEALALNAGGVGYYPGSDFIHLDTGPVRSWS